MFCVLACSTVTVGLEAEVRGNQAFRLVDDDGRTAVRSAVTCSRDVAREWGKLAVTERERVERAFGAIIPGRIEVHLVGAWPSSFDGDAFSAGTNVYLKASENGLPRPSDGDLLVHEVTHVAQATLFAFRRPFWFEEGLATYVEGVRKGYGVGGHDLLEGVRGLEAVDPARLTLENLKLQPLSLAYRLSASAFERMLERHGSGIFLAFRAAPADRQIADVYATATGEPLTELEARWRTGVDRVRGPRGAIR